MRNREIHHAKRLVQVLLAATLAAGLASCGNNTSTTTAIAKPLTVSALSGTYVFSVTGTDPSDGDYSITGSLTADGKGNITGGVADYNLGSGIDPGVALTGTYTVVNNTATIALTDSAGLQESYLVLLGQSANAVMARVDGNGSGTLYAPVTATATAPSTGTFAYTLNGEQQGTLTITGNFIEGTGGTFTSGTESLTDAGVLMNYTSVPGFLYPIQSNGRGLASLGGSNMSYYLTGSSQILLQGLDDRALLYGAATRQ